MNWFGHILRNYKTLTAATVGCLALTHYSTEPSFNQIRPLPSIPTLPALPSIVARCKDKPDFSRFDFIADAAEVALPAVVSIDVVQREYVFDIKGSGSGFIVDKRGYVITNEHVIAGKRKASVTVVLSDGRKLEGSVVAVDSRTDLALIKVDSPEDLPELRMGDDTNIRPGQWVVAIGNSLHFPNTVTAGIVSNTSRNITENELVHYQAPKVGHSNYIQTDAAINPGSSGGPLVNLAGEVIGVNTMGMPGAASGIAFSIPVSEVKRFLNEFSSGQQQLTKSEKVDYHLGLKLISLEPGMASFLHHNGKLDPGINSGVFIFDTHRNSPARQANLVKGDVIVAIEDLEVRSRADLVAGLQRSQGTPVQITFFRPHVGFLVVEVKPERTT